MFRRGAVSVLLSVLVFAFLACAGAVNSFEPIFCDAAKSFGESALENCVYELYLYQKSSGCKILSFNVSDISEIKAEKLRLKNEVKGERLFIPESVLKDFCLNKNSIKNEICSALNAEKAFEEKGEDFYNEYYYSKKIKTFLYINGKKVNFQVSVTRAGVSLSSPVAFGAY
ncbi:MAG: hypothetical protein SOX77_02115 [Candidatus Borkfalkiaceae bacterium]|nr:hypothetical protein [Christensenellaceae bacterium]